MKQETRDRTISIAERVQKLREAKMRHTKEKQELIGNMDYDDWALIPPSPEKREVAELMGPSGEPITDILFKEFEPETNHSCGGFFGPAIAGRNYRKLLEYHPVYIDKYGSLAGGYMVNFFSTRQPHWNPDYSYEHLVPDQEKYGVLTTIGGVQHMAHDLAIGLELGWKGLLEKIEHYRELNGATQEGNDKKEFYDGLEDVVRGMQNWIHRHSEEARRLAEEERDPQLQQNLVEMAEINERLVNDPPRSFREACQWILWYQTAARMYNNSGSLGRLDLFLHPYYTKDKQAGILTDEEAVFHIAQNLLRVTDYIQVGGYDEEGNDNTNEVSFLILDAAHLIKIPANIAVAVGGGIDRNLMKRGVELLFEDRLGIPKFLGLDTLYNDFTKNGYPIEIARQRTYNGCHWFAIPGREYGMNDLNKINFPKILDLTLREAAADHAVAEATSTAAGRAPADHAAAEATSTAADGASVTDIENLWSRFEDNLQKAIAIMAEGLDFHIEHMHKVFPELVLDLLSYGPVEKGMDVSRAGCLDYINLCVDGSGLATVADSFAAIERRIDQERRISLKELVTYLDSDWEAPGGDRVRAMMKNIPHYGSGGSPADRFAKRIVDAFTKAVLEKPTPNGHKMLPGLFSWAATISMGKKVGATPNGRRSGEPISFGSNPDPGFRKDGALTALAEAVAAIQPGWGNPAPLQIEVDPGFSNEEGGIEKMCNLIETHFELGGTEININILDKEKVLEADKDPSKYPDLVVRVTGFSAYFASLSPEMRRIVVDRIVTG